MKRETAWNVRVKDILAAPYEVKEGWEPNVLKIGDKNIARVQIMGTIVNKEPATLSIDDASATIMIRMFEPLPELPEIGDLVRCVGKPREYEGQRCIVPEIVKKVEQREWFTVWEQQALNVTPQEEKTEEKEDNIVELIKSCDQGQGASIEEVIKKANKDNAEQIINRLLEEGEIFEIKKGFVKVLS